MKRSTKQLLSALLVIAMMLSLLVVMPAAAAESTHTFDATALGQASVKDEAMQASDFTDSYFSLEGTVKKKVKSDSDLTIQAVEVAKEEGSAIVFTVATGKTATAVFDLKSAKSDGSQPANFVLRNASGKAMGLDGKETTDEAGIVKVSTPVTGRTYTDLPAGTYKATAPGSDRGCRVVKLVVTEKDAATQPSPSPSVEPSTAPSTAPAKTEYTITVDTAITGGTVTTSPAGKAEEGATVTVTATPATGKELDKITVDGTAITGATFTMPGKNVTVSATFKDKAAEPTDPPAANEWTATLDGIPGEADANGMKSVADETEVTTKVSGVKFYIGGHREDANNTPNVYKLAKQRDEAHPDWPEYTLTSNNHNSYKTGNAGVDKDGPVPVAGTYYKWVAEANGVLEFVGFTNGDTKYIYVTQNGAALTDYNGIGAAKAPLPVAVPVSKGDVVTYAMNGSKPMLASFKFTEIKPESATWDASVDKMDGIPGEADANGMKTVADETEVTTKVPGVKFYIGGHREDANNTPNVYKLATQRDEAHPDWPELALTSNNHNSYKAENKGVDKDGPVPVAGTYYKWVAENSGVLEFVGFTNGDTKYIYVTQNGKALADYNGIGAAKAPLTVTVPVKAGDVVTYAMNGSKPMLASFTFTKGAEMDEKKADWTMAAICGGKIDVTPSVKDGTITVTVTGPYVGKKTDVLASTIWQCADEVVVEMYKGDELIDSLTSTDAGNSRKLDFKPEWSGDYTFKAIVKRSGEATDLVSDMTAATAFKLPLAKPVIKSANSAGGGKMTISWAAVNEAEGFNVYMDAATTPVNGDTLIPGTATSYTVEGLEIGSKHTFKVESVQGTTKLMSDPSAEAEVTVDARRAWVFKSYGPSSSQDPAVMGYEGGVNAGETLDLWSLKGNGKLKKGSDGLAYYFTEVPADENFVVKAKIHVNYWAYSGAQEGFGIMAADTMQNVDEAASGGVGAGKDKDYWTNNHMIAVTKTESDSDGFSPSGRLGIMMYSETGVTSDPRRDPGSAMVNYNTNLDARAVGEKMTGVKFYNIVGNMGGVNGAEHDKYEPNDDSGKVEFPADANVVNFDSYTQGRYPLVTDFWMELKRTNDGYFATWYAEDGTTVIKTASRPHPNLDFGADADVLAQEDALLKQDPTTVNVGFIASRHAHVTISDVTFDTSKKVDDPKPVAPPAKIVKPTIKIASSTNANDEDYNLILTSNVVGTAEVKLNGQLVTLASGEPIKLKVQEGDYTDIKYGDRRADVPLKLKAGNNSLEITFTPAPDSEQLYDYEWSKLDENMPFVTTTTTINLDNKRADRVNIYVAPTGSTTGTGSKDRPMTLPAAVKIAQPGQKIILMEGTYKFSTSVEIPKSISGKPGEMIYMIADPEATSRPVLDFMSRANVGVKVNGDYWYLEGFDVTRSQDRSAGINVGGHYNTLVDLRTYLNGNSGIQISRSGSADGNLATWPSNNLILNCISFLNADAGKEDADGFAAKLTCGPGNVFRGCISAYNADDGWDLYAKSTTTGPIGQVTLENCVAFKNGILLVDANDTSANPQPVLPTSGVATKEVPGANGNGFKMGGENLSGHHILRNSYAFWNKGKGIDSNSCPDDEIYNNVSYSNGNSNVALYSSAKTAFKAQGLISFKDSTAPTYAISSTANGGQSVGENLKPVDQSATTDYNNDTTYYWDGSKTANASGKTVDAATLFESLTFAGITYDAKTGTYSMGDFLKLKADADKTVGEGVVPNDNPGEPTIPGGKPDTTVDPSLDPADPEKKPSSSRDERGSNSSDPAKPDDTVPGLAFVDVKVNDWFADSVKKAFDKGLMKGVDAEHFAPNANTTRAMVATVLFRMDGENKTDIASLFNDVTADTWYTDAVAWAADKGIVKGYDEHTFAPDDNVTREQLAAMLYRYAAPAEKSEKDLSAFTDAGSVSEWATEAITWAVDKGIMNGKGDGILDPQGLATRAEICTMLVRFLEMK